MIKYAIVPGFVTSPHDGNKHWLSAGDLMRLYGVDPMECVISEHGRPSGYRGLIRLKPRADGNYKLNNNY